VPRFERERRVLCRDGPAFFALSAAVARPGDYLADSVGGVPWSSCVTATTG
jgi:hypothetical protein